MSQHEERIHRLLTEFRMEKRLKWFPAHFSKGMKQKVMIMCAFLVQPALYIVDEPFVGLDPLGIQSLLDLMKKMKENGAGILMSTHILTTAENIVIVLLFCMREKFVQKEHLRIT